MRLLLRLNKSLCGCNLRNGSLTVGYIQLILYVVMGLSYILFYFTLTCTSDEECKKKWTITLEQTKAVKIVFLVIAICGLLESLIYIVLLYGIYTVNESVLRIVLCVFYIVLIANIIQLITYIALSLKTGGIAILISLIFLLLLKTYFYSIVESYYYNDVEQ